jgi:type VI protein secretion system component Hcp
MYFQDYDGNYQASESQVDAKVHPRDIMWKDFGFSDAQGGKALFEIEDFSFDIEQTLNIGSQSTGIGAGAITFNPFSITRKIDRFSPRLYAQACSGTPFKKVALGARKASGGDTTGAVYLVFLFKLVGVKTIAWSYDDQSPKETVTFEYGGLQVHYAQQEPNGGFKPVVAGGWNRVRNITDTNKDQPIQ